MARLSTFLVLWHAPRRAAQVQLPIAQTLILWFQVSAT